MARVVDPKRTRKALKALASLRPVPDAEASAVPFTDWENSFITEVGERLEKYGSAFADYGKGAPEEALSRLQLAKLQELRKKARNAAKGYSDAAPAASRNSSFDRKKVPTNQKDKRSE
jgi:hypothetical protein